jgi:nuclear pore complex protein Nup88
VENSTPSPLCGFIALSDSFGYSWIAVITSNQECVVLEMRTLNLLLPVHVDMEKKSETVEEWTNRNPPDIISKELLIGPKVVLVPQGSPNLRSVAADSIEGRSTLHQYLNLFHENYVEYAHKVRIPHGIYWLLLPFTHFGHFCCCLFSLDSLLILVCKMELIFTYNHQF